MLTSAMVMILFIYLVVMLMRAESIIYFKFNKWLYLYSIITATFLLSRYLFGALYRTVPVDPEYVPGVTILIPCFNEEEWIKKTIISCVNQDYPVDKLEIIVIDDHSTDRSVEVIKQTIDELKREGPQFDIANRVSYLVQPTNLGKRDALCEGVKIAKHELVVFVDSDSFLDPFAVRYLVQPFKDKKMGGVAGRTDVANTYTNALTKMQSVRYYISFRAMKAAEAYFDVVTCLSGPLSCYRKQLIIDHMDEWLNQSFLGQKATFGDDRAMTNIVLKHHRTFYQDTAFCSTIVPNSHKVFLKQQMRWKRSWLRESLTAGTFMWRKEPWSAFFFYIGLVVPVAAPIVVLYNLVYVPITQRVFPTTFIAGLLLMAMLMSVVQLLLRRSSTWLYGMLFCLYYEFVLLWQMPWAWVTFWKSTWGTRETAGDVKEIEKKRAIEAKDKAILRKRAEKKLARGGTLSETEKLLLEDSTVAEYSAKGPAKTTEKKKFSISGILGGISAMFNRKDTETAVIAEEKNGMEQLQELMIDYAKSMADMETNMANMFAEHAKVMNEFSHKFEEINLNMDSFIKVAPAAPVAPVVAPVEQLAPAAPVVEAAAPVDEAPIVSTEDIIAPDFEPVEIPQDEEIAEETVSEPAIEDATVSESAVEVDDNKDEVVEVKPEEKPVKKEKKKGLFGKMFGGKKKAAETVEAVEEVAEVAVAAAGAEAIEASSEEVVEEVSDANTAIDEAVLAENEAIVDRYEAMQKSDTNDSEDDYIEDDELAESAAVEDEEETVEETVEEAVEETVEIDEAPVVEPVDESLFDVDKKVEEEIDSAPVDAGLFVAPVDAGLFAAPENDEYASDEYTNATVKEDEAEEEPVVEEEPAVEEESAPSYDPELSRTRVEELNKDHEKEAAATSRLMDNMYKRHREELQRLCDELNVEAAAYDTYDENIDIPEDGDLFRLKDMIMAHINEKKTIEKLSEKMRARHEKEARELCEEIYLSYEDYMMGNF